MMDAQRKVADSVAKRGYRDGWTAEQFLARQVAKLTEELAELAQHVAKFYPGGRIGFNWQAKLIDAGDVARRDFDNPAEWHDCGPVDLAALRDEAADILVVLFNIAEASNVIDGAAGNVVQAAVDKAAGDEARGVR
jgi:NTP pyrophosphatase (non-canonical NTP hydrolase)